MNEPHAEIDVHTEHDAADIALCKNIYGILESLYPGHPWAVGASHSNGVAHINLYYPDKNGNLSRLGHLLHIRNLEGAYLQRKVMRAGGELLERCRLKRARAGEQSAGDFAVNGFDKAGMR